MPRRVPLWLNRNELSDKVAIVDDEDYDKVMEALIKYRKDGSISKKSGKWYYWESNNKYKKSYYAMNGGREKSIHRLVTNAPKGMDVDHINGDGLDNRKANLRLCTRSQNAMNRRLRRDSPTGYKGVAYVPIHRPKYTSKKTGITTIYESKLSKPYRAYIGNPEKKNRQICLGYYTTGDEAAKVRDKMALKLHKEFAYLNFPELREQYLAEIRKEES